MAVRALADLGSQTFWLLGGMRMKSLWAVRKAQVVGIDLSANERQESGICLLREGKVRTWRVRTDDELVTLVQWLRPHLVAIDAPLSLPLSGWLRPCDCTLLRRGIRLFPVTMGAMRQLTERGIRLRQQLEGMGFTVVEVFSGGAQDVLGLPRKHHDLTKLRDGLKALGLEGIKDDATHDELDAITAAFVGWLWLCGLSEQLSDGQGGGIVMPLPYPPLFLEGVRLYQQGFYWHAHEAWEELWRNSTEPYCSFLKALIQIAAALIHCERNEWQGVRNLLRRVQRYLEQCPDEVWGVDVAALRRQVAAFQAEVEALLTGLKRRFNWRLKPRLCPDGMLPLKRERLRRALSDFVRRS
ncbi:MAG: hypothetical protein C4295_09070 [Candidatus Fervidibacterota bacterium]